MPKRPCLESGCGSFAVYRGRCADHSRQREQRIERIGRNVYRSKKWQVTRRHVLFEEPLCRECGAIATEVDHINGRPDDNRPENLQPLCAVHHGQKTRREQLA